VRSWKAEGEEKERDDEGDGNIASRKVDLWKARRLETCTTVLGRGVRDIRALLWGKPELTANATRLAPTLHKTESFSNPILIKDRNRHTSDFHVAPSRFTEASRLTIP
jgi:hypothetical protein